jgi:uncharacterized protein GlcG (DUF336 family)
MKMMKHAQVGLIVFTITASGLALPEAIAGGHCSDLGLGNNTNAIHAALQAALSVVAPNQGANGGLGNHMWATLVDRDGIVCAVAFTGANRNQQWPGSRAISAQKANTAMSFNLPGGVGGTVDALSTANLWTQAQPGGSLFGLQFSNPVDTGQAYKGLPKNYGTANDPMVNKRIGGVNVFGGGLGLYDENGDKVGAIGVSGDTSCADHNIAWRTRNGLGLDNLATGGVSGLSASPRQDNIIYDVLPTTHDASDTSASGFGHPICGFGEDTKVLPPTQ